MMDDLQAFLSEHDIKHFSASEITLLRRWNEHEVPPKELWGNIIETLCFLEGMRILFGPIMVYSGYRTPEYNKAVGGAKNSQHMLFRAIDSAPVKHSLLRDYEREIHKAWLQDGRKRLMGIGGYKSFVHIDFGYRYRLWGKW